MCVVLRAAADAAVFESPVHSSKAGEEPTGLQLPFLELCAPQLHRAQRADLTQHWAEWSGGYRAGL